MQQSQFPSNSPEVPDTNLIAKVAGIVLSPKTAIPKLLKEKGFWFPVVFVGLSLACYRLFMLPEIYEQYASPEFRDWYMQFRGVGYENALQDIEVMKKWTPILTMFEALVMVISGVALVALIVRTVGIIALKQLYPFKLLFKLAAWVSIVSVIPVLISIPIKLIFAEFTLPTSLGLILPSDLTGDFFHRFLLAIDIFLIWQVYLLSIGVSSLYKINFQKSVNINGTIFIILALFNAVFGGMQ